MIVFLETQDCLLIPIKKSIMLLVSYVLYCLKTITEGSWIIFLKKTYYRVVDPADAAAVCLGGVQ